MKSLEEKSNQPSCQKAWVVFMGKTELPWLKILKPGFRHCYAVLNDGKCWMSIDPLATYTDIQVYHHIPADFNLPDWLKARQHNVISASINKNLSKATPFMLYTCVESIKRVLGIQNRFIITPWQLYKFLQKQSQNY